jgi:hypothetical protein
VFKLAYWVRGAAACKSRNCMVTGAAGLIHSHLIGFSSASCCMGRITFRLPEADQRLATDTCESQRAGHSTTQVGVDIDQYCSYSAWYPVQGELTRALRLSAAHASCDVRRTIAWLSTVGTCMPYLRCREPKICPITETNSRPEITGHAANLAPTSSAGVWRLWLM